MKIPDYIMSNLLCCALCLTGFLSATLMSSCADDIDAPDSELKEGYITLSLSNCRLASRAAEATNEFLIDKALVCFFTGEAPADDSKPVYADIFDINLFDRADIKIKLTTDLLNRLFPAGNTKITAYVIANLDGNVPGSGQNPDRTQALNLTLSELKKLAIESDFADMRPQASFVMDGQSLLTLVSNAQNDSAHSSVSGTVDLQRAAAKIMLGIKISNMVADGADKKWKSMPADMKVIISNGVKKSNVTPNPAEVADADRYSTVMVDTDNPDYSARGFTYTGSAATDTGYPYELSNPFYTYPTQWDARPTSLGEDMTYLQLMVPWEMQEKDETTGELKGAGIFRTCYYAIPVLQTENVIERNTAYQINISVNILGSFRPDQPELIEDASYRAVGWGVAPVSVEIQDYRYLVLDQTEYTVNNAPSLAIPFYSSHETIVIRQDMWYSLYNTSASGLVKKVKITEAQNNASTFDGEHIYSATIDNNLNAQTATRTLNFTHNLVQWTPLNSSEEPLILGPDTDGNYPGEATINERISAIASYRHTDKTAYSTYVDTIYIAHKDKVTFNQDGTLALDATGHPISDPKFTKMIIITQYPGMYIETTPNFFEGSSRDERTPERGNMYVNGNQEYFPVSEWGTWYYRWYVAYGLGGSSANANPNQYVITITTLTDGSDYIIDDPRVKEIDNLTTDFDGDAPANAWAKAPAITDGTNGNVDNVPEDKYRQLEFYYPANPDKERMNVIAPKIRIASSYGVGGQPTYLEAQRRCASYQELQYPAGRWRIPTKGEIEYIMSLSVQGKIPALFTKGSVYWSAEGPVKAEMNADNKLDNPADYDTSTIAGVRCVYDEWYWEKTDYPILKTNETQEYNGKSFEKYPFTWGDMPISQSNRAK